MFPLLNAFLLHYFIYNFKIAIIDHHYFTMLLNYPSSKNDPETAEVLFIEASSPKKFQNFLFFSSGLSGRWFEAFLNLLLQEVPLLRLMSGKCLASTIPGQP